MKAKHERGFGLAPYAIRQQLWDQSRGAIEKHIQTGRDLQTQGETIINALPDMDVTAEQAAKLIQQGTAIIEKGIKIEREAHDKLMDLYKSLPKK